MDLGLSCVLVYVLVVAHFRLLYFHGGVGQSFECGEKVVTYTQRSMPGGRRGYHKPTYATAS